MLKARESGTRRSAATRATHRCTQARISALTSTRFGVRCSWRRVGRVETLEIVKIILASARDCDDDGGTSRHGTANEHTATDTDTATRRIQNLASDFVATHVQK